MREIWHLEVEHPAAKVLVELSNLQDIEVGDGKCLIPGPYFNHILQTPS